MKVSAIVPVSKQTSNAWLSTGLENYIGRVIAEIVNVLRAVSTATNVNEAMTKCTCTSVFVLFDPKLKLLYVYFIIYEYI